MKHVAVKITRIAQSCVKLDFPGLTAYIDPYKIPAGSNGADVVLVTHPHPDHFNSNAYKAIKKDTTRLVCPVTCSKIISKWKATPLNIGEQFSHQGVTFSGIPAYNLKLFLHKPRNLWLGYIIKGEGMAFYHAGDTDLIPEMRRLGPVDVALLPIGGTFTMNLRDAIEAVRHIKPRVVIPMHELRQDMVKFKDGVQSMVPGVEVALLHPGETKIIEH